MQLEKEQKDHLLTLIAAGLKTREINKRAAKFNPPYKVERQQVDYYRDSREVNLKEIEGASESDALRTGLALREVRVETLKELAERIKRGLLAEGRLLLKRKKVIGRGEAAQFIEEEDFNLIEFNALRTVLDDIAQEVGERGYGTYEESESEDGSESAGESGPQELRIKVEYVGGHNPEAANAAPGAASDQS